MCSMVVRLVYGHVFILNESLGLNIVRLNASPPLSCP